jgi:hypothetical protein
MKLHCYRISAVAAGLFALFSMLGAPAWAQDEPQESQAPQSRSALQLDSVSAYTAYYSDGIAPNSGQPLVSLPMASDVGMGLTATVTWIRDSERSDFSLTYTADYAGRVHYSAWDALNHFFSMNAVRHLTPRWDLHFALGANLTTADRLTLLPAEVSLAVVSPSLLLYGDRMFGSTGQMSLAYKVSTRTSVAWNIAGSRYQSLSNDDALMQTRAASPLYQSTTASTGVEVSHTLSPRTEVSVEVGASQTISGLLDARYSRASVSLSHKLTQRWSIAAHGGGGTFEQLRPAALPAVPLYLAGGAIGYRTPSQNLQVSCDRSVGDSYGLGAASTFSTSLAWNWRRPGSPWLVRANIGQQQFQGGLLGTIQSWQAAFSVGRTLTTRTAITAEYGYMRYSGGSFFGALSPSSVRLSMVWKPSTGSLP